MHIYVIRTYIYIYVYTIYALTLGPATFGRGGGVSWKDPGLSCRGPGGRQDGTSNPRPPPPPPALPNKSTSGFFIGLVWIRVGVGDFGFRVYLGFCKSDLEKVRLARLGFKAIGFYI